MDSYLFTSRKEKLIDFIKDCLKNGETSEKNRKSLIDALNIVNLYTFENSQQLKGLLTYKIIDSLELDHYLAEQLMWFDKTIS